MHANADELKADLADLRHRHGRGRTVNRQPIAEAC
jgi:hypothetical protein